jgi:hypothetical protein
MAAKFRICDSLGGKALQLKLQFKSGEQVLAYKTVPRDEALL